MKSLPWQRPNATEAYTAEQLEAASGHLPFPWATWIDRARRGCRPELPPTARPAASGIRLHPFPLYPVRCATHPPTAPLLPPSQRPLLYSFQGADAPGLYLTPVRQWLLELPPRPDAQLERRQEWHYEQAVYREQVQGQAADAARHAQLSAEASAYATTLQRSCFALCPSGSGPNSIRLWEALGYGAIPVILAESLALPLELRRQLHQLPPEQPRSRRPCRPGSLAGRAQGLRPERPWGCRS